MGASQSRNDVHLRIDLDSRKAQSAMDALKSSVNSARAEMDQLRAEGKTDDDPQIKALEARIKGLTAVLNESKQSFIDINEAILNVADLSSRQMDRYMRELQKRGASLTGSAEDAKRLAEYRENYETLRQEREQRDVKRRDFATAADNLLDQTPDQIRRLVEQAKAVLPTLQEGTDQLQQTFEYYKQFRERYEEQQGKMTLTQAQGLADGSLKGGLRELQQATTYLREYREEWSKYMSDTEQGQLDEQISSANDKMLEFARNIATGVTPASFQEMTNALVVLDNAMKTLDPTIDGNKEKISALQREYLQLSHAVEDFGTVQLTAEQQAQELAKVQEVIDKGSAAEVKEINAANEALKMLGKQSGVTAAQQKKYADMTAELNSRFKGSESAARQFVKETEHVNITLKNLKTAPVEDLDKAMKILEDRMKRAQRGTKEYIEAFNQIKKVKGELNEVNDSLKEQGGFIDKLKSKFGALSATLAGLYAGKEIAGRFFSDNLDYSDALADIQKTTGLTGDSLNTLANRIKEIDTRTTIEDMNSLAYSAGRLGVDGVENVLAFTKAANMLTVSLGDELGGSEAVESLMKISDLMGSVANEGLEQALLSTGSAINEVTQASTAAAGPIVEFMERIASVGHITGMNTADLVGLGSAIDALGQNVEASASSVQKMLIAISTNTTGVAKALKMTNDETKAFVENVASGNMTEAFMSVLRKANELGGLKDLQGIMKDLGGDGVRVIQTLTTLAENYGKVGDMIALSNEAYREGTSVVNEYNVKNEDALALWQRLQNNFKKLFVSPEAVEWLRQLLLNLQGLPNAIGQVIKALQPLGEVIGTVIMWFSKLTPVVTTFIYALVINSVLGFAKSIFGLVSTLGTAVTSFGRAAVGAQSFAMALKSVGAAAYMNIFTAIASVVATIAMHFYQAKKEAEQFTMSLNENLAKARREADKQSNAIQDLVTKLRECGGAEDERKRIIAQMNEQYADYLGYLLDEKQADDDIARSLAAVNAQLRMKALLQAKADSEEQVRSSFSGQRELQYQALFDTIEKRFIKMGLSADKAYSKATEAVDVLIDNADSILRTDKDQNGNVINYYASNARTLGDKFLDERATMATLLGKIGVGTGLREDDGINRTSGEIYGDLANALENYMDVDAKMQSRLRQTDAVYDRDLRKAASQELEVVSGQISDTWSKIEKAVTQDGKITGEVSAEDAVLYKDYQDGLKKKDRDNLEQNLKAYISYAQRVLSDYATQGKSDSDEAKLTKERMGQSEALAAAIARAQVKANETSGGNLTDAEKKRLAQVEVSDARAAEKEVIDNIKTIFKAQEAELKAQLTKGKIDNDEYNRAIETNNTELHTALRAARLRIVGELSKEDYAKSRASLSGKGGDQGSVAYTALAKAGDLKHIGDTYRAKRSDGAAALADLRREAEEDANAIEDVLTKRFREIEKMLLEQDLVGKVKKKYQSEFYEMGMLIDTASRDVRGKMMDSFLEVGKNAFAYDIKSDKGLNSFREYLMSFDVLGDEMRRLEEKYKDDPAKQATAVSQMAQAIYYKAYDYAQATSDAERRVAEQNKKRIDWEWDKDPENLENKDAQTANKTKQSNLKLLQGAGFDTKMLQQDATVEMYKLRLEAAAKYYEFLKVHGGTEQQLADAQRSVSEAQQAYTESMLGGIEEKMAQLKEVGSILENFGEGIGEAMMSESETVQEAVGEMINSFIKLTFEYAQQELNRWITKQMYQKMNQDADKEVSEGEGELSPEASAAKKAQEQVMSVTKKGLLSLFNFKKKKKKEEVEIEQDAQEEMADVTEVGGSIREALTGQIEKGITATLASAGQANVVTNQATTMATVQTDAAGAAAETAIGIAEGSAKTIGQLGWWGIPLLGIISATLGALLNAAMSAVSSAFGGGNDKGVAATKTKLVTGMLTYDAGNVQSVLRPYKTLDDGTMSQYPVLGDDGRVYNVAHAQDSLPTGMVSKPTLTTINGAPALVGERGPEMVIGRETTRAMQMYAPELLQQISLFDRHRSNGTIKTYDEGNASAFANAQVPTDRALTGEEMRQMMLGMQAALAQSNEVNAQLVAQLQRGIKASINKFGAGGLVDEVASGFVESKQLKNNKNITRLFG